MTEAQRIKRNVISWFRYQHYSTNPCMESHAHFMGCLSFLETKTTFDGNEHDNADKIWSEMLVALNTLSDQDFEHLNHLRRYN